MLYVIISLNRVICGTTESWTMNNHDLQHYIMSSLHQHDGMSIKALHNAQYEVKYMAFQKVADMSPDLCIIPIWSSLNKQSTPTEALWKPTTRMLNSSCTVANKPGWPYLGNEKSYRRQCDRKGPEFRTLSGSGPKCQKWSGIGPELGTRDLLQSMIASKIATLYLLKSSVFICWPPCYWQCLWGVAVLGPVFKPWPDRLLEGHPRCMAMLCS